LASLTLIYLADYFLVCNRSCQLILSRTPGATLQDLCKINFGCYNILLSYCGWYLVAYLNIAAMSCTVHAQRDASKQRYKVSTMFLSFVDTRYCWHKATRCYHLFSHIWTDYTFYGSCNGLWMCPNHVCHVASYQFVLSVCSLTDCT